MGIFDGADQKQMAAAQQMNAQMEMEEAKIRAKLYNQAQAMGIANQNALTGIGATLGGSYGLQTPKARFDPNKSEAYQIPLSQLVAMWQVKYGDQWVDIRSDRERSDFYWAAETRLGQNDLFERVDGWARLKENVEKLLADR